LYDPYVSQNFTIRDLLCHRSGLATFSGDLLWHSTSYSREEIIRRIKYLKPVYGFRSHYGYSNLMFLTAGEIIPAITDTSFDDFLKYRFFEPLEMQNTNISIRFQKGYSNLAIPHITKEDKVIPIDYISWDNIAPAGGINSTVNDMNHWLLMQLESGSWNGKVILPEEIQQELWSSNMVQNVSNMQHFLFPSIHFNTYGMGWDLFDYHGRKVVNHSGGLDGMISQVALVPEEKFGVVILTNSMNYLPYALMHTVIDLLMDYEGKNYSSIMNKLVNRNKEMEQLSIEKEEQSRNIKSKPSLALEDYTGVYTSKMYGDAEVKITDDQLFVQFKPAPVFKSKLEHWQYDTFKI
ncbi:MAG: serine hydrolase, partial [Marinilabiliales bacterium]